MVVIGIKQLAATGMKQASGYLRRSTDRQEQSIEDQRKTILWYARENGFEVVRWYIDDALSGTSTDARKAFLEIIADAQESGCSWRYVLVYDIKRFGRVDNDEAGHYRFLLRKAGVEVIYTTEGFTGGDTDDLLRPVKQWQARQESKDLSKVTIRGQLSLSEGGWWVGGAPPYGYDLIYSDGRGEPYMIVRFCENGDKEIYDLKGGLTRVLPKGDRLSTSNKDKARLVLSHPDRVAVARRIFDMYVHAGMGYRAIACRLNDEGIPSPRSGGWSKHNDGHWSLSTIRSIIINRLYVGDMVWNRRACGKFHKIEDGRAAPRSQYRRHRLENNGEEDWIIIRDAHEAIIDRALFERAARQRPAREKSPVSKRGGRAKHSHYLLSGLIRCASCGHAFQGYTQNSTKRRKDGSKIQTLYYTCGGYITKGNSVCKRVLFPRKPIDEFVTAKVREQVKRYLRRGGQDRLRKLLTEELQGDRPDPRAEIRKGKLQIEEIDQKADTLLDNLTDATRDFVERKLDKMRRERKALATRLDELQQIDFTPVDMGAVVEEAMTYLKGFERVAANGTMDERKTFMSVFVPRVELDPHAGKGRVFIRECPLPPYGDNGHSSFELVAGTGFEPATSGL